MTPEMYQYKKLCNTLTSYLRGKGYNDALKAFNFAEPHHSGFRKDGKTPNFQHQVEICLFLMTLKQVENEEQVYMAALLHDVREDADIVNFEIEKRFGKTVAEAVEKLTKEFKGSKKTMEEYFGEIASCPIASLVKLADRIHNVNSMVGVFTIPKQEHYLFEIKEYFFPMLKTARKNFPEQYLSYIAMNTFLKSITKTIEAVLVAEKENDFLKNNEPIPVKMKM